LNKSQNIMIHNYFRVNVSYIVQAYANKICKKSSSFFIVLLNLYVSNFKDLNKNVKTGRIISRLNSSSSLQILLDLRSVFAIEALYFTVESHVAIIYKVYVRSGLFSSSSTVSSSLLDPSN
jgi:hypothetical protein